jgi:methylphosphotriester-DNA--protein-cysteine methyltransferase
MTTITSTVVHHAEIRFREADVALRPYVGCFWVISAERDATIRIVPDGSTSISTELQNGRTSGWWLRGPLVRPDERRFSSPSTIVGVRLRPGVAFILSGMAAHAMVGVRIDLSTIAACRGLVETHPAPKTPSECIDALERFLLHRLRNASVHDVVAAALREIEHEHGCSPVGSIADRCRVSARHLNRLMRIWIGFGPKYLASIIRFQTTLKEIEHDPARSGAALATETGYFDQAHLTTNVTRFAGATPRHLASRCVSDFSKTRCDDLP